MAKGHDAVWAYFGPEKPCGPLSVDGRDETNKTGKYSVSGAVVPRLLCLCAEIGEKPDFKQLSGIEKSTVIHRTTVDFWRRTVILIEALKGRQYDRVKPSTRFLILWLFEYDAVSLGDF